MAFIKYAVYVLSFACAVMFVRKQMAPKIEFHVGGFVKPGFEAVEETFRGLMNTHMYGGAFSAYYRGNLVVDLWGGYADVESKQLWEEDTISMAFSTTKAMAALCVGVLVTRGNVKYDDLVSDFWPEFAANGKETVTLRTLLNHQAGLISLDEPLSLEDIRTNAPKVSQVLARQKPLWEPGISQGYHSNTFGLYLDQVVRRVDPKRRNISKFFDDEIAEPLGIDFSLHLKQSERYRDARLLELPLLGFPNAVWNGFETWDFSMVRAFYDIVANPQSMAGKSLFAVKLPGSFNNIHAKVIPVASYSGHGTARAIAKLLGMIAVDGGIVKGEPLISDDVLLEFMQVPDNIMTDLVIQIPLSYSAGMMHMATPAGDWMFGAPGLGGQMGFADPKKKIGLGFLTNHLQSYNMQTDPRTHSLFKAVYACVKNIEQSNA